MALNIHLSNGTRYEKIRNILPHMLLLDTRTMFSVSEKNIIQITFFFNSDKNSGHAYLLHKIAYFKIWCEDRKNL